jgi:hypothetical protein
MADTKRGSAGARNADSRTDPDGNRHWGHRPASRALTDTLLPFDSSEERIAHNEAWSRRLNERHADRARGLGVMAGFRCECWQEACTERIPLSREDWTMVRAEPNRFAVAPNHIASSFEAVVKAFPHFWMVEKFGAAGEIAEELDSSD